MSTESPHSPPPTVSEAQAYTGGLPPIRVICPHCHQRLEVVVQIDPHAASVQQAPPAPASPLVQAGRQLVRRLAKRLFPMSGAIGSAIDPGLPGVELGQAGDRSTRRWLMITAVLAMVLIVAVLILWGRLGGAPADALTATPTGIAASAELVADAAIRDTLTRYNAAETEAAALLTIEPLRPFLDPGGPFAVRRAAELAERQRQHAPHRSILVRWGIGAITVSGDTATAVTQETWSNQEAGAVAPEQATVRVTYTLRWDAATGRWLILETSQMLL